MVRSRFRILIFVLGLLALGLVLAIVGGAAFLRSEAGQRYALSELQKTLRNRYAVESKFSQGSLDLFSGWHFKDLQLSWKTSTQEGEFRAAIFDVRYQFSLLGRWLNISEFSVLSPQLKAKISLPSQVEPTAEERMSEGSLDAKIDKLRRLIEAPPVRIEIQNLALKDLGIDLQVETADSRSRIQMAGVEFRLGLDFLRDRLALQGDFDTGSGVKIESSSHDGDAENDLHLTLHSSDAWKGELKKELADWLYEFKPTRFEFHIIDFVSGRTLRPSGGAAHPQSETTTLRLPRLDFSSLFEMRAHTKEFLALSRNSVDLFALDSRLQSGSVSLLTRKGSSVREVLARSQKLTFKTQLASPPPAARAPVLESDLTLEFQYEALGFQLKSEPAVMGRASQLTLTGQAQLKRDLSQIQSQMALLFDGQKLFAAKVDLQPSFKQGVYDAVKAQGEGALDLTRSLSEALVGVKNLKQILPIHAEFGFSAQSRKQDVFVDRLDFKNHLQIDHLKFGTWAFDSDWQLLKPSDPRHAMTSTGRTEINELAPPQAGKLPMSFAQPIVLNHDIGVGGGESHANFKLEVPQMSIEKLGQIEKTVLELWVRSPDLKQAKTLDLVMSLKQGAIRPLVPAVARLVPLNGFLMDLKATLRDGVHFSLDEFNARLNDSFLQVTASANGNLKSKDFQVSSQIALNLPEHFPAVMNQFMGGKIFAPLAVSIRHGHEIDLIGDIGFDGFSWSKGAVGFSDFSGRVPFSEKILLAANGPEFVGLEAQNAFERVNFERLRPLLQNSEQISIGRINWEERSFGPLIGYVSIKQNMLSLHQFDLDLGSGRVYGEMFLDMYPKTLQFGFLSRMTGLDLTEILPKRFLAHVPAGAKTVSGRCGFVLDLVKSTIDGRVDITEIGGAQLITMMNLLDPTYDDEKLNKARSVLAIGYPTAVALSFQEGYLDMDIDLTALGISERESLRAIPVSGFISSATQDFIANSKQGVAK